MRTLYFARADRKTANLSIRITELSRTVAQITRAAADRRILIFRLLRLKMRPQCFDHSFRMPRFQEFFPPFDP